MESDVIEKYKIPKNKMLRYAVEGRIEIIGEAEEKAQGATLDMGQFELSRDRLEYNHARLK